MSTSISPDATATQDVKNDDLNHELVQAEKGLVHKNNSMLFGLSLGYFMVLLDTTVVTVALPSISQSFHTGIAGLQWVSNSYTLTFASFLLTMGAISDRFGGRRVFLIGISCFAAISAISAFSGSVVTLIVTRALLGIAGAALLPTSLAVIANAFTAAGDRAKALGGWAAITGTALAAGPIIGGLLTDTVGWRSIFVLNVPVAVFSFILTLRYAPETKRSLARGIDLVGQITSIISLSSLTYFLIEGESGGWLSPNAIGIFSISCISGVAFVAVQTRIGKGNYQPMLPLSLFKIRAFSGGVIAGLIVNFGLSGLLFILSIFFQDLLGYSAMQTGMAFLPLTLPTAFNPILTGRLVAKIGPRLPAILGFLLMAAGTLVETPFVSDSSSSALVGSFGLCLVGFGVSFAIPSLITAVVSSVPRELTGSGSGALNSSRQTGALLGVAVLGSVLSAFNNTAKGTSAALFCVSGILLIGAVVAAICLKPKTSPPTAN